jgi:hypothetical protein
MDAYKRNQAVEAISFTLGQGQKPSAALRTKLKRLLDTDRTLGLKPRSKDPEWTTYAFYSGEAPGRGSEVWFSGYEVFALLIALNLMEHGWPQATAVALLRRARSSLETKHAEILQWDPSVLFDEKKIMESAKAGTAVVRTTHPVYLVIASRKGRPIERSTDETREVVVLDNEELMPFLLREAGLSSTMIELVRLAHELKNALVKTIPSKRGRGSS